MFKITWAAILVASFATTAMARAPQTQRPRSRSSHIAGTGRPSSPATDACRDLNALGDAVDELYAKPTLKGILGGIDRQFKTAPAKLSANGPDSTWVELVNCANKTQSEAKRAEALRVAAMWEHWRATTLWQAYMDSRPVPTNSCKNLGTLDSEIVAAEPNADAMSAYRMPTGLARLEVPLTRCAEESEKLNRGKPVPEFARAYKDLWMLDSFRDLSERNTTLVSVSSSAPKAAPGAPEWVRKALSYTAALILLDSKDQLDSTLLSRVAEHNRRLCDQIVTVAGLTPEGLALYIPPEGRRFMAKNARRYPRMCLLQDTSKYAPGVPRYLLVWAYSNAAFAGFQAVQQTTTEPVSGTGTVTNLTGERWNFTYTGTETEIETLNAPYVVQSRSLYLRAYDEAGRVVSQHSVTTSRMVGGDTSYAAGYNAGALISALWNNPSRLIKRVLKDVQRDSRKNARDR